MIQTDAPPTDIAAQIAAALGETAEQPRRQIARAVQVLGEARALAFLAETQEVEAAGGLMTSTGTRKRTPGGTYFKLMRSAITGRERRTIFPHLSKAARQARDKAKNPSPALSFDWFTDDATWQGIVQELLRAVGEATTVKATVIGRPAKIEQRDQTVLVGLRSAKVPAFPKGVPAPAAATPYMVLIARKQWERVADAIKNPEDALIVEGYPTLDPRFPKGITLHATNVTTKHLQAAKRETQATAAG